MNKSQINRMAKQRQATAAARPIAQNAPGRPQEHAAVQAVNLSPETIDALVGGFSRELRRALLELGPILARIAAADTIHTVERVATVLGRAVVEGQTAADVVNDLGAKG